MIPEPQRARLIELGEACLRARDNRTEHGKCLTDLDQYVRFLRRTLNTIKPDAEADQREDKL